MLLQFYLGILIILLALAKLMNYSQHTGQGKYPVGHSKMESFKVLAVMLSWMLSGAVGIIGITFEMCCDEPVTQLPVPVNQ